MTPTGQIKSVCVFCGSAPGRRDVYRRAAEHLGRMLAARDLTLVYGGGDIGLMGVLADASLAEGGRVIGVIPRALADREVAHRGVTDLRIVGSMHERKALMSELSDAFLALPGGLGTFEELCEILTWAQLGIHAKPIGLLNVDGYYRPLIELLDHAVEEGFLTAETRRMLLVAETPEEMLAACAAFRPPAVRQWIDASAT